MSTKAIREALSEAPAHLAHRAMDEVEAIEKAARTDARSRRDGMVGVNDHMQYVETMDSIAAQTETT